MSIPTVSNRRNVRRSAPGLAALFVAAGSLGCAKSATSTATGFGDEDSGAPTDAGTAHVDATSNVVDSGGGAGLIDATPEVDAAPPVDSAASVPPATIPLPFYVSDQFIPSGFMNDPTGITVSSGVNGTPSCPSRAPTEGGVCYVVTWASTGPLWAGVFWQFPANNWGAKPGLPIAAGAKQITFQVRGDVGGEVVQFQAGGVNDPTNPATGAYGDNFEITSPTMTLTTSWQPVTMSLSASSYGAGVLGGFCWIASQVDGGNANIKFYVDDLEWQ